MRRLCLLLLFLAGFYLYLRGAAPSVTAGDSGEFITASATLSLPHAPSFPTYVLAGHVFMDLVPLGSEAYRSNVFSAFLSAFTLLLLFVTGRRLGASPLVACAGTAAAAFFHSFWMNSLVTEVFALNSLFAAMLLCSLATISVESSPRRLVRLSLLATFLLVLGLGNHHILIVMAPAFGIVLWRRLPRAEFTRSFPLFLLFLILGFSAYLFLPIRAAKNPPLNWGQPTTMDRFVRTVTRKDYGSFSLALGETPVRSRENALRHMREFARQAGREAHPVIWTAGLIGLFLGLRSRRPFYPAVTLVFFLSGPFFYWFANMPFTAQTTGVMGRFFILPMMIVALGLLEVARRTRPVGWVLLGGCATFLFLRSHSEAAATRSSALVMDYGRTMFRSVPPDGALLMDGGDDAFYASAMLQYVENRRPDLALHDRGGLIFKNIYGEDFRRLTKEEKSARRLSVEKKWVGHRPVFYSSMSREILPGVPQSQVGLLYEVSPLKAPRLSWALIMERFHHPVSPSDYRTRALASFYPFMRANQLVQEGRRDEALDHYRQARHIGGDVDWLQSNLVYDYSHLAYESLIRDDLKLAERIYNDWIDYHPKSSQAHTNLGVVYERQGRIPEAIRQYEKAAVLFPSEADPVYNLAVIYWRMSRWSEVKTALQEVLRRNPNHAEAVRYLSLVDSRLQSGNRD